MEFNISSYGNGTYTVAAVRNNFKIESNGVKIMNISWSPVNFIGISTSDILGDVHYMLTGPISGTIPEFGAYPFNKGIARVVDGGTGKEVGRYLFPVSLTGTTLNISATINLDIGDTYDNLKLRGNLVKVEVYPTTANATEENLDTITLNGMWGFYSASMLSFSNFKLEVQLDQNDRHMFVQPQALTYGAYQRTRIFPNCVISANGASYTIPWSEMGFKVNVSEHPDIFKNGSTINIIAYPYSYPSGEYTNNWATRVDGKYEDYYYLVTPTLSYNAPKESLEWNKVEGAQTYEVYKDGVKIATLDADGNPIT